MYKRKYGIINNKSLKKQYRLLFFNYDIYSDIMNF